MTLLGGNGSDSISNYGDTVLVDTGADNDYVYNQGDAVNLKTGAGNDTIKSGGSGGNLYQYPADDGHDTIIGYSESDTINRCRQLSARYAPGQQ